MGYADFLERLYVRNRAKDAEYAALSAKLAKVKARDKVLRKAEKALAKAVRALKDTEGGGTR